MQKLKDKVAVVTGGSEGIGLAAVLRFVEEGAQVFILGRRKEQLDQAATLGKGAVTAVQGDVTKAADLDRLFDAVKLAKGRIDVLFANAGNAEGAALGAITPDHFNGLFALNVGGVLFTVQKALPLLADGASVILTGSMVGSMGLPGMTVYSATKAALRSFARTWTVELKDRGIRVNLLSPGPTLTSRFASAPREMTDSIVAYVPLGRAAELDEIAAAALFLASSESSYVAGTELFVDGGAAQV